jgi:hypothetical protein
VNKIKSLLSNFSITPVLFAISFILILFNDNSSELTMRMIITPLIASAVFALILSAFFVFVFRDKNKGSLFSSILVVLFFSFGEDLPALKGFHTLKFGNLSINSAWLLFIILLLLIVEAFILIKKTKKDLSRIRRFVLFVAIIVVIIPLLSLVTEQMNKKAHPPLQSQLSLPSPDQITADKSSLPDIYYIVPEDYSSSQVLKDHFNYDNTSFTKFLEDHGFYIAQKSTSNYPKTFLSVASSLNMEYLDYLSRYKKSADLTKVDPLIEDNNVLKLLKSLGYSYYQMGSWWPPTKYNPLANANITIERKNLLGLDEFNYAALQSTMFKPFLDIYLPKIAVGGSDAGERKRINFQFDQLSQVVGWPSPKFVFLHLIAPHGPYVFGKNCISTDKEETEDNEEEENYVNQADCINLKLEAAVTQILKQSKTPPVIIIQTDEGAPFLNGKVKPKDSWKKASPDLLKEKFPIFSAFYFPGKGKESLYETETPVNTFRLVFNNYFGTNFPILPDKNYIFPDLKHLYEFKDVTAIVKR